MTNLTKSRPEFHKFLENPDHRWKATGKEIKEALGVYKKNFEDVKSKATAFQTAVDEKLNSLNDTDEMAGLRNDKFEDIKAAVENIPDVFEKWFEFQNEPLHSKDNDTVDFEWTEHERVVEFEEMIDEIWNYIRKVPRGP